MLSLISNLVAPRAVSRPHSVARAPTGTGTQLPVARTSLRASDSFSIAVGAKQATDIGAMTGAGVNAGEGASLLTAADAGLSEISSALTRMKELATEAKTAAYSRGERAIMNAEFDALRTEIDSIADRTEFSGNKALKGMSLAFKVGTGNASHDSITVSLSAATVAGLDTGLVSDTIDNVTNATLALTNVTNAIDALGDIQATVDGTAVGFEGVQRSLTLGKNILTALKTDLLERPVTIGTSENLTNLVSQEYLSKAVPAAVSRLSSAERILLSTSQLQPIEPSQAADRAPSQDEAQLKPKAVTRLSAYERAQNTTPSTRSEATHSVDIEA